MGSAVSIPDRVDFETFRVLTGGKYDADIFNTHADSSGTIPRDRLIALQKIYFPPPKSTKVIIGYQQFEMLSTNELINVFKFYSIPVENIIRSNNFTGATLSQITSESDLNNYGFQQLSPGRKRRFLKKLIELKQSGVSPDAIANKSSQLSPNQNKAFKHIVTVLADASSLSDIALERALEAIPKYIGQDPERHFQLGTEDGLAENMVNILRQRITSKSICFKALTAIKILCRFGVTYSTTCEDTVQLLVRAGVCEAVVVALRSFAALPAIAEAGCWVIRNVATNMDSNKEKLGRAGACEAVAAALQTHGSVPRVLEAALWAVHILAVDDGNRSRLGDLGTCEAVLAAMEESENLAHPNLVEQGCEAVLNLAHSHQLNRHRLSVAGACEWLVRVVETALDQLNVIETGLDQSNVRETGLDQLNVLESACGAILNLSHNNEENALRLGTVGACEAMVSVLRGRRKHPEVVEQVCGAMLSLSFVVTNKTKLRTAGAKKLLAELLEDAQQSQVTRFWAKGTVENLS